MSTFTVACIQNTAERDIEPSIGPVVELIRAAAARGADLVTLPEMVTMIEPHDRDVPAKARAEDDDPGLAAFRAEAAAAGVWMLIGSLLIRTAGGKVANRSFVVDPGGNIVARYDKLHLFDVDLDGGETYRESATVEAGDEAVLAPTPWGLLGLSVCYDLRFAYLYRALAQGGASFIGIPAAFTYTTGKDHWHVLVRARAIETGCFVFAPNQCGIHAEDRRTWGHSLIVNPWGEVLADGGDEVGLVTAEIDPVEVERARRMVPALKHDRRFDGPRAPVVGALEAGE
ncbi:MAG: carbon-nitrogen hydrolase family protein [Alphaproteobacteria bacterium]|nr:carbon-nitrogen hydrolase family protein [Alphaproteobacteria bacterium]